MRPDVIVADRTMRAKVEVATRAAVTDLSVLLLGEDGVGKALFARMIHAASARQAGPFEEVNCRAVPPDLIDDELFGHADGGPSANGPVHRPGRFERADGGTIMLDAVDALSPDMQARLLGVLQHGRIYPESGGARMVDTRVIAASGVDLEGQVERAEFRRDLFYRLNVLPIYLPPLRERPNDVAALAQHFLKRSSATAGRGTLKFTAAALAALRGHRWPGNARELANVVERAAIAADSVIDTRHIDLGLDSALPEQSSDAYHGESLKEAVRAYKRRFIRGALESHGWNQTTTARSLGIQRTYLSRLIKELEISNR
ncbi:MAG: sigma 54-interacting transcriptional regulator [Spirochaetaceae bacterium]|nr:sigma 54-interacting transcriptional regulator [Spirochaetaceae bacterium]